MYFKAKGIKQGITINVINNRYTIKREEDRFHIKACFMSNK